MPDRRSDLRQRYPLPSARRTFGVVERHRLRCFSGVGDAIFQSVVRRCPLAAMNGGYGPIALPDIRGAPQLCNGSSLRMADVHAVGREGLLPAHFVKIVGQRSSGDGDREHCSWRAIKLGFIMQQHAVARNDVLRPRMSSSDCGLFQRNTPLQDVGTRRSEDAACWLPPVALRIPAENPSHLPFFFQLPFRRNTPSVAFMGNVPLTEGATRGAVVSQLEGTAG